MIIMDVKTQLTVDIIAKVAQGKMTISDAAKLLDRSKRTIERYLNRYLNRYHKIGIQFVVHGNVGKSPHNKIDDQLKRKVQKLIKDKYFDVNLQHLTELLSSQENINIKRETLRTWAHEIHHVKRAKKRRPKARKKRERMAPPGLLMQMDGSHHQWFGDAKSCLIAIIDDATSDLYAEFFPSETTQGCLKILRDFINKNGLFKVLYVDKAGIFGGPKRCDFSQVKRACGEIGIEIIFANSPQGKGRIERAFDTLQDRLVPEFRMRNITSMQEANEFLQKTFIPQIWQRNFIVQPKVEDNMFTSIPKHLNIEDICILKAYRKIRNDHTFSYSNKLYLIESPLRSSIAKQEIEIRKNDCGNTISAYFANKPLAISEVVEPKKPSIYDLEIQKKLDAIKLADTLGNVAKAARISKCSRETIYRNRRLLKEKGPSALKRTFNLSKRHKNRTHKKIEDTVVAFSLENPHLGQAQVSAQLKSSFGIELSPNGVRNIWLREKMNTCALRVQKANAAIDVT